MSGIAIGGRSHSGNALCSTRAMVVSLTNAVWLMKRLALAGRCLYLVVTLPFTQHVGGLGQVLYYQSHWRAVAVGASGSFPTRSSWGHSDYLWYSYKSNLV